MERHVGTPTCYPRVGRGLTGELGLSHMLVLGTVLALAGLTLLGGSGSRPVYPDMFHTYRGPEKVYALYLPQPWPGMQVVWPRVGQAYAVVVGPRLLAVPPPLRWVKRFSVRQRGPA